jgi:hypothetical protein
MWRTVVLGSLSLILIAASAFDSVDRETARRLVRLAKEAADKEQMAAVRRILGRALELHPDNSDARERLGYVKSKKTKEWKRSLDDQARIEKWTDADEKEGAAYLVEIRDIERWRSRRCVRLAAKMTDEKKRREALLDLLLRTPKEPMVHEALGHPKIGEVYVRPSLASLFRARGKLDTKWAKLRDAEHEAADAENPFSVPGVPNELPTVVCGEQEFVTTLEGDGTRLLAADTQRVYALITALLGAKAEPWAPYRFCVLDSIGYRRMIHDVHDDPEEQKARMRFGTYAHEEFFGLQAENLAAARDYVAHSIGFYSMQLMAAPGEGDKVDTEAYAFLREGFGYLLSIELFDSAAMYFHSDTESASKVRYTIPPPKVRNRKSCTAWLTDLGRRGELLEMPQVFGRSLNNLDFHASIQAWSFLRFLSYYDPAGFRNLPLFLREKEKGSYAARVEEALEDSFEVSAKRLEKLWRAWLMEIEGPN